MPFLSRFLGNVLLEICVTLLILVIFLENQTNLIIEEMSALIIITNSLAGTEALSFPSHLINH